MFSILLFADVSGITQKWNKLRRRCASFKAMSGPSSLDSDTSYILNDPPSSYTVLPRDDSRLHLNNNNITIPVQYHHQHLHLQNMPLLQHNHLHHTHPHLHHHHYHLHHQHHQPDCPNNPNIDNQIWDNGKQYRTIRFRHPHNDDDDEEEYWRMREEEAKMWKLRSKSPRNVVYENGRGIDWEYNVQKYEGLDGKRREKLQYYSRDDLSVPNEKKMSVSSESGCKPSKELKIPGLKAFKSASMRLPGQKTSIQEVQQLLRNKFNRIQVGLRKRRALSVQEVFNASSTPPQHNGKGPPPTFYVPSPIAHIHNTGEDDLDGGPQSLPFLQTDLKPTSDKSSSSSSSSKRPTSDLLSPKMVADNMKNGNSNRHSMNNIKIVRSHSYKNNENGEVKNIKIISSKKQLNNKNLENDGKNNKDVPSSSLTSSSSKTSKPIFAVGGRVSLHENNNNTTKLINNSNNTNTTNTKPPIGSDSSNNRIAVKKRQKDCNNKQVRPRPRSHSPMKFFCRDSTSTNNNTPINKLSTSISPTTKKSHRESFGGFFEKINRLIGHHQNHNNTISNGTAPVTKTTTSHNVSSISGNDNLKKKSDSKTSNKLSVVTAAGTSTTGILSSTKITTTNNNNDNTTKKEVEKSINQHLDASLSTKKQEGGVERDRKIKKVSILFVILFFFFLVNSPLCIFNSILLNCNSCLFIS